MYEIIYDYCNEDGCEEYFIHEIFEGSWTELQEHIKDMKKNGCYNIEANAVDPDLYELPEVTDEDFY